MTRFVAAAAIAAVSVGLLFGNAGAEAPYAATPQPVAPAEGVGPPGDGDLDGDVDLLDVAAMFNCYSGADTAYDAAGAVTHTVNVGPGFAFVPDESIINQGDTILWDWIAGLHNVESGVDGTHDGNFTSGDPVKDPDATFSLTFDGAFLAANPMPGNVYPYYCIVHWFLGMQASVIVNPHPCAPFDMDFDGDIDLADHAVVADEMTGP